MAIRITIFGLSLVLLAAAGAAREAPPGPDLVAATWLEPGDDASFLVVALHLRNGKEAATFHVGYATEHRNPSPGGYGEVRPEDWHAVEVGPREVVLVRRRFADGPTGAVLVADSPATEALDGHELVHGEHPPGTRFYGHARSAGATSADRHLVPIGEEVELLVKAPGDDGFFREETFEIARVARRLGVGADDPDGERGHVAVAWRPEKTADPAAVLLEGEEGEKRIRSHFTDPHCNWANRHVGWLPELFLIEYRRPTPLRFTLDTSPVKDAGVVSDLWKGYGAVCVESIWPNGFGGSSSNYDLPAILIVPEGTAVREVVIP